MRVKIRCVEYGSIRHSLTSYFEVPELLKNADERDIIDYLKKMNQLSSASWEFEDNIDHVFGIQYEIAEPIKE